MKTISVIALMLFLLPILQASDPCSYSSSRCYDDESACKKKCPEGENLECFELDDGVNKWKCRSLSGRPSVGWFVVWACNLLLSITLCVGCSVCCSMFGCYRGRGRDRYAGAAPPPMVMEPPPPPPTMVMEPPPDY